MASLMGIYRPSTPESNLDWIQSVARQVNALSAPDSPRLVETVTDGGEFVTLGPSEAIGGLDQSSSPSGQILTLVAGHVNTPEGAARELGRLYEAHHLAGLKEASGPFVCLFLDKSSNTFSVARSLSGQRAIFVAPIHGGLVFSTDACWLSTHQEVGFALDENALADYLNFGVIWGTQTLSQGVERILPGTGYTVSPNSHEPTMEQWGLLPRGDEITDPEDAIKAVSHVLGQSMTQSVASPAPRALCLSAGLDSRTLLAIAHNAGLDLDCITTGVDGALEFVLTERMCKLLNARHQRSLFDERLGSDLETFATQIARISNGEADYMNMMMLYQGGKYHQEFGLESVIRGHGGELMKLDHAYGFAVPEEIAWSTDHTAAKARIQTQLRRSVSHGEGPTVLSKHFSPTFQGESTRSFNQSYDAMTSDSAHVGQTISRLFLTQYNGRNTANAIRCMMEKIDVWQPILDEDVLAVLLQIPIEMRSNTDLQIELIRRNCPALLSIPSSSLGVSLTASKMVTEAASLFLRIKRRLGFEQERVPEDWLNARISRLFKPVLESESTLGRPHLNPDALKALLASGEDNLRLNRVFLGRLAIVEMMLRHHEQYSQPRSITRS